MIIKRYLTFFIILILFINTATAQEINKPVVYTIGDSTVKNGQDKGDREQWGWGRFLPLWFNDSIDFENYAIGGRSSRSFITEGRWEKVRQKLKKGDYVIIQFGHNDGGEMNTGRARASIKGIDDKYEDVVLTNVDNKENEGKKERVYTYGHYLRQYINEAKEKGATPIICSLVPRNRWENGKVIRDTSYAVWAEQVAENENVPFIPLHTLVANQYDIWGEILVKEFFSGDHTHTSLKGALINAETVAYGIKKLNNCNLKEYLKD